MATWTAFLRAVSSPPVQPLQQILREEMPILSHAPSNLIPDF
jgi:hypothetical protein